MSLFNPSRDQVRTFFFDAWAKFKAQKTLTDLEKIALGVMHMHPEYHAILDAPEQFKNQEYFPEFGETNPFLHMSLHLSILEQVSINQPIGIAEIYQQLKLKHQNEHEAQHDILECLGDVIWQAQRNNTALDSDNYVQLLQQKAGKLSQ
jgi:predicted transcriptional regulator